MVKTATERPSRSVGSTRNVLVDFSGDLALIDRGTVQSATSTTVVLAESASTTDDHMNTHRIYITGGTAEGESQAITDYTGSTRTATTGTWGQTPDSTSTYEVREVLTGTPTVAEQTTSDLTLANKAVSTEPTWPDGERRFPGQVVQFNVTGGTAGERTIRVTTGTTSTPAQTLLRDIVDTVE